MRLLLLFFSCIICLQSGTFAELSSSSCSVLRTASSISTIVPEFAQLAMRYYRVSSYPDEHHRQKRFLFNENQPKDGNSVVKGSVLEQMAANAFKDVNFTKVALLILNNNETMSKIRQNVDGKAIVHAIMRDIDYEKLGHSLWHSAETEFDLEYFISSFINITHMDVLHEELITNGTLPDWFIKSIHPDLNTENIHRMFLSLKNISEKFIKTMNSSERLDDYLFNLIQKQGLIPVGNIIQKIKDDKPTTLDQLIEIILNNINKIFMVKKNIFSKFYCFHLG
jgi:hypothetical protein